MNPDAAERLFENALRRYGEQEAPALSAQFRRWSVMRPLAGLRVLDATPLFFNTTMKHAVLLAGGADLTVACGSMPCDPEMPNYLTSFGIDVRRDPVDGEYDVVLDCAGAHCETPAAFGYAELTRSGIPRYVGRCVPVFATDSSRIKSIETALGTGDGCLRAMKELGLDPRGHRILLFGHGRVGRGIELRLVKAGARCIVVDPKEGKEFRPNLLNGAWAVVSATGVAGALAQHARELVASGALLINMGAEDEFGPDVPPERAVNEKLPINFRLAEPTRMRYIDATMALHNAAAEFLARGDALPGLIVPPRDIEETILSDTFAAGLITQEVFQLKIL